MRKSAKYLGEDVGLSAQAMNVWLKREGFLEGEPGNYRVTDKGFPYARQTHWDAGDSHNAGYPVVSWPEEIFDNLGPLTPELRDSLNNEVDEHNARKRREAEERRRELSQYRSDSNASNSTLSDEEDSPTGGGEGSGIAAAIVGTLLTLGVVWAKPRVEKWWNETGRSKFVAVKEKVATKFRQTANAQHEKPASGNSEAAAKEIKDRGEKN